MTAAVSEIALQGIHDELEAFVESGRAGPGILRGVVDRLAEGLGAGVIAHRPELSARGWASGQMFVSQSTAMERVATLMRAFMPRAPLRYAHYDPLSVQADQRNRVLRDDELRALYTGPRVTPVVREVYRRADVCELQHTRVVICDGPFLLCWLGLWREEPFSVAEERIVASAVPKLVGRLCVERLLWGGTPTSFDVIGQTLELVGRPAFLLNGAAQLVFVNDSARAMIDRDRSILDDVSEAAVRGIPSPRVHSVTPIGAAGMRQHFIVLAEEPGDASRARLRAVVQSQHLTDTQARVLQWLVRGDANKDIATKLRCAPRTVELHVTAILRKCAVESRARLIAWFWTRT